MSKPDEDRDLDEALQRIADEGLEKVLPTRRKGERRAKFVQRCMANPTMNEEFPSAGQRFAVCRRQADKVRDSDEDGDKPPKRAKKKKKC